MGGQRLLAFEPDRALSFDWILADTETTVAIELTDEAGATLVTVTHEHVPPAPRHESTLEDFWSRALLNLQAWSERRAIGARPDYVAVDNSEVRADVEIAAPRTAVYATLNRAGPVGALNRVHGHGRAVGRRALRLRLGRGADLVRELASDERLIYSWTYSGETGTVVTWELAESNGRTRLTLVHGGFAPDDERPGYQIGWLEFLVRIKLMVEVGATWQCPQIKTSERAAA
jgi:uncharacterized protein YndB with AHSA1/START domain